MVMSTTLRPQAPEFQPQADIKSADSMPSGSNTAVPTPSRTPNPTVQCISETAQKMADKIAAVNRGSFSTVSESTMAARPHGFDSDETCSPEITIASTDTEISITAIATAKDARRFGDKDARIGEGQTSKVRISATPLMEGSRLNNTSAKAHVYMGPPQQFYYPVTSTLNQFSPVYSFTYPYSPNISPYSCSIQPHHSVPFLNTDMSNNLVNPQGQTIMSAGPDPISEGRRIYIGNLKYNVNRHGIKRLLRAYGVNQSIEKIYMPYNDIPLESPSSTKGDQSVSTVNTPTSAAYPSISLDEHTGGSQHGDGISSLPNKGFVFVTYGNVAEAEEAIKRISGVVHLGRRLVCRPGLPKGVAFRQADNGSRLDFFGGSKGRRQKMFRGSRHRQNWNNDKGYGNGNHYGYDLCWGGRHGAAFAPHGSMDSGYRSSSTSVFKAPVTYYCSGTYGNGRNHVY